MHEIAENQEILKKINEIIDDQEIICSGGMQITWPLSRGKTPSPSDIADFWDRRHVICVNYMWTTKSKRETQQELGSLEGDI